MVLLFAADFLGQSWLRFFAESPHCEVAFSKVLFSVAEPFSAARFVPSGFSDKPL